MKLSFSSLPCENWSVERMLALASSCGYQGIELREGQGFVSVSLDEAERRGIAERFREANVEVTNIGTSICVKGNGTEDVGNLMYNALENAKLAHDLGAKAIRIFLGNFAIRKDAPRDPINEKLIVERVRQICDITAERNINVWIETHNEYATGKALRRLLDRVGKSNCAVIWDILHPLEDGETPEETLSYLGRQCAHLHMKDGVPFEDPLMHDWRYTMIGQGRAPITEIAELLLQFGYEGYFSLEWETKWRKELQSPGLEAETIIPHYTDFMEKLKHALA